MISRYARLLLAGAAVWLAVLGGCTGGRGADPLVVQDVARLQSARVAEVVAHERVRELQVAVREADRRGLRVAIAGSRHSQGGHTFYPDALVLDMRAFDEILFIDAAGLPLVSRTRRAVSSAQPRKRSPFGRSGPSR